MPREDRRIIFSHEESYKALYGFCTRKEGVENIPPGHIQDIEQAEDTIIRFIITNPQQQKEHKIEYPHDFVAAALMVFCKGVSVPLPKQAHKSVEIVEGELALRVQM